MAWTLPQSPPEGALSLAPKVCGTEETFSSRFPPHPPHPACLSWQKVQRREASRPRRTLTGRQVAKAMPKINLHQSLKTLKKFAYKNFVLNLKCRNSSLYNPPPPPGRFVHATTFAHAPQLFFWAQTKMSWRCLLVSQYSR